MSSRPKGLAVQTALPVGIAFLLLAFATGGGSRADIASLLILRSFAALFFGIGCYFIQRDTLSTTRGLWIPLAVLVVIAALHLVPLPPSLWAALPGHDLAAQVAPVIGFDQPWRPLSLVPWRTENALVSLIVPTAALTLWLTHDWQSLNRLLIVVVAIGVISALFGMVQVVGPPDGPFYLYDVTNDGSAVGLFANRNHHAVFLAALLPLIGYYAGRQRHREHNGDAAPALRPLFAAGTVLLLAVVIILTGSRAGLLLGAAGLAAGVWIYFDSHVGSDPVGEGGPQRGALRRHKRIVIACVTIVALIMIAFYFGGDQATQRFAETDQTEELRLQIWPPLIDMTRGYLPLGSGIGTLVEIYQIGEPDALLSENYLNHAHNDYIEVALTGGIPMMLLVATVLALFAARVFGLLRAPRDRIRDRSMALAGASAMLLLILASVSDYPLRVPSLACFFALAATWLYRGSESVRSSRRGHRRGWRGGTDTMPGADLETKADQGV